MNVGERLYPVVKDLLDNRVFQIIRPETAVDKTTPYLIYTPIASTPEMSQSGYTGYDWFRTQIDIYHDDFDELDSLVAQVLSQISQQIRPCDIGSRQYLHDHESLLYRQSFDIEFFTQINLT